MAAMHSFYLALTPLALIVVVLGHWLAVSRWSRTNRATEVVSQTEKIAAKVLPFPAQFPSSPDLVKVEGLTYLEAEDLLDWLQHSGFNQRDLLCDDGAFAVEFSLNEGYAPPTHKGRPVQRFSAG
jgi:hypothetical protein